MSPNIIYIVYVHLKIIYVVFVTANHCPPNIIYVVYVHLKININSIYVAANQCRLNTTYIIYVHLNEITQYPFCKYKSTLTVVPTNVSLSGHNKRTFFTYQKIIDLDLSYFQKIGSGL